MSTGGTKIFSPQTGICYTFNSGSNKLNDKNPLKVLMDGPKYGLDLEIDVECKNIFLLD